MSYAAAVTLAQEADVPVERAVSWLNRPEDVIAHLFFVAAEIGQVQVDIFKSTIRAVLAFPQEASHSIDVIFPQSTVPSEPLGAVRMRYHHEGNSYEFITAIQQVMDDRRWRLVLPHAVARWAGRGAQRFSVRRDPRFHVALEREDGEISNLQICDISTTGLSFFFRPEQLALQEGDSLLTTLMLPGEQIIPIFLEIRHTRPENGPLPLSIAGCQIVSVSPWGGAVIAQAIAGLGSPAS